MTSPALLTTADQHCVTQYRKILDYAITHWLMRGGSNDHSAADRVLQHIAALEQRVEAFAATNAAHVERLVSADKLLSDAATILDEFDSPLLVGSDWHRELRAYRALPKEPR